MPEIAAGTTKGNLASVTRLTYLPLLIDFLQVIFSKIIKQKLIAHNKIFFLDSAHLPTLIAAWLTLECRGGQSKSRLLF